MNTLCKIAAAEIKVNDLILKEKYSFYNKTWNPTAKILSQITSPYREYYFIVNEDKHLPERIKVNNKHINIIDKNFFEFHEASIANLGKPCIRSIYCQGLNP